MYFPLGEKSTPGGTLLKMVCWEEHFLTVAPSSLESFSEARDLGAAAFAAVSRNAERVRLLNGRMNFTVTQSKMGRRRKGYEVVPPWKFSPIKPLVWNVKGTTWDPATFSASDHLLPIFPVGPNCSLPPPPPHFIQPGPPEDPQHFLAVSPTRSQTPLWHLNRKPLGCSRCEAYPRGAAADWSNPKGFTRQQTAAAA